MEKRFCVRCTTEIPAERLECMPETKVCVRCSEEIGGEFALVMSRTQLGKPGSLKKVTGGVEVQFVRKEIPPLGVIPPRPTPGARRRR